MAAKKKKKGLYCKPSPFSVYDISHVAGWLEHQYGLEYSSALELLVNPDSMAEHGMLADLNFEAARHMIEHDKIIEEELTKKGKQVCKKLLKILKRDLKLDDDVKEITFLYLAYWAC